MTLHPIRALKYAVRRWTLRRDAQAPETPRDLPPALERFQLGESLPWKGTTFKVGKIIGGDFPCLILVPSGRTRGETLRGLRRMRDVGRAYRDERRAVAASLRKAAG